MALLIAVEGIDGSGKGTQVANLASRVGDAGKNVTTWTFPQYESNRFGKMVGRFLNGDFGGLDTVRPELSALLFAGDRFESLPALRCDLETYDVVFLDRYVASNIAHQAGRLVGEERQQLTDFLLWLEHDLYGVPRPNITFWLDLPVAVAQERIKMKAARSYTDRKADLQEEDTGHLTAASEVYAALSDQPNWRRIDCGQRSEGDIADELFAAVAEHCG